MIDYPIIVSSVNNHKKHKKILLNQIEIFNKKFDTKMPCGSLGLSKQEIAFERIKLLAPDLAIFDNATEYSDNLKSDWVLPQEIQRDYLEYFYNDVISNTMNDIGKKLGFDSFKWTTGNTWFQQYFKNAEHNWHNHTNAQFTNCYYLELPDEKYKVEIVGIDKKIIQFEAKEGDVVTCPSWMKHRSPPNGKNRKTSIAFNSNYEYLHL